MKWQPVKYHAGFSWRVASPTEEWLSSMSGWNAFNETFSIKHRVENVRETCIPTINWAALLDISVDWTKVLRQEVQRSIPGRKSNAIQGKRDGALIPALQVKSLGAVCYLLNSMLENLLFCHRIRIHFRLKNKKRHIPRTMNKMEKLPTELKSCQMRRTETFF